MEIPSAPIATPRNQNEVESNETPESNAPQTPNMVDRIDNTTVSQRYRQQKGSKREMVRAGGGRITKKGKHSKRQIRVSYPCHYCDAEFKYQLTLRKHIQLHLRNKQDHTESQSSQSTNQSEILHKCSFCESVFKDKAKLERHENLHKRQPIVRLNKITPPIRGDLSSIKQPLSNKQPKDDQVLESRTDEPHNMDAVLKAMYESMFHCNYLNCNAMFKDGSMLDRHMKLHQNNDNRTHKKQTAPEALIPNEVTKLECPKCDAVYRRKDMYDRHVALHSLNAIKLAAESVQVDPSTPNKTNRDKSNDDLLKCNQCEAVFKHAHILRRHEALHEKAAKQNRMTSERGTGRPTGRKRKEAMSDSADALEAKQSRKNDVTWNSCQNEITSRESDASDKDAGKTKPCSVQLPKLTMDASDVMSVTSLPGHVGPSSSQNAKRLSNKPASHDQAKQVHLHTTDCSKQVNGNDNTLKPSQHQKGTISKQANQHKEVTCSVQLDKLPLDILDNVSLTESLPVAKPRQQNCHVTPEGRYENTLQMPNNDTLNMKNKTDDGGILKMTSVAKPCVVQLDRLTPNSIQKSQEIKNNNTADNAHIQTQMRTDKTQAFDTSNDLRSIKPNHQPRNPTIMGLHQPQNPNSTKENNLKPQNNPYNRRHASLPQGQYRDKRKYVQTWIDTYMKQTKKYQTSDSLKNVRLSPLKKDASVVMVRDMGSKISGSGESGISEDVVRALRSAEKRFLAELNL